MRFFLNAMKILPHPEPVEGRTTFVQRPIERRQATMLSLRPPLPRDLSVSRRAAISFAGDCSRRGRALARCPGPDDADMAGQGKQDDGRQKLGEKCHSLHPYENPDLYGRFIYES
jgi:hypothetical protein